MMSQDEREAKVANQSVEDDQRYKKGQKSMKCLNMFVQAAGTLPVGAKRANQLIFHQSYIRRCSLFI